MKRIVRIVLILAFLTGLGLLPFRAKDVAELLPVKTVIVTRSGGQYVVDVGAGVRAVGKTVAEALERLREEVAGTAFFGSAEQVIVTDAAADAVDEVTRNAAFRPAAGLYRTAAEDLDAEAVGRYLDSHPSNVTILQVRAERLAGLTQRIPRLIRAEGGFLVDE